MISSVKPFRERVLDVVRAIPKGSCLSYQDVARRAGSTNACRAVGTILSKNFDPEIPCHRVIRSDGKAGGYNGLGKSRKEELLRREGCFVV